MELPIIDLYYKGFGGIFICASSWHFDNCFIGHCIETLFWYAITCAEPEEDLHSYEGESELVSIG